MRPACSSRASATAGSALPPPAGRTRRGGAIPEVEASKADIGACELQGAESAARRDRHALPAVESVDLDRRRPGIHRDDARERDDVLAVIRGEVEIDAADAARSRERGVGGDFAQFKTAAGNKIIPVVVHAPHQAKQRIHPQYQRGKPHKQPVKPFEALRAADEEQQFHEYVDKRADNNGGVKPLGQRERELCREACQRMMKRLHDTR